MASSGPWVPDIIQFESSVRKLRFIRSHDENSQFFGKCVEVFNKFTNVLNSSPRSFITEYKDSLNLNSFTLFGSSLTSRKLEMYLNCFSNSLWRLSIEFRHNVTFGVKSSGFDSTLIRNYSALACRIFDSWLRMVLFESAGAVLLRIYL